VNKISWDAGRPGSLDAEKRAKIIELVATTFLLNSRRE